MTPPRPLRLLALATVAAALLAGCSLGSDDGGQPSPQPRSTSGPVPAVDVHCDGLLTDRELFSGSGEPLAPQRAVYSSPDWSGMSTGGYYAIRQQGGLGCTWTNGVDYVDFETSEYLPDFASLSLQLLPDDGSLWSAAGHLDERDISSSCTGFGGLPALCTAEAYSGNGFWITLTAANGDQDELESLIATVRDRVESAPAAESGWSPSGSRNDLGGCEDLIPLDLVGAAVEDPGVGVEDQPTGDTSTIAGAASAASGVRGCSWYGEQVYYGGVDWMPDAPWASVDLATITSGQPLPLDGLDAGDGAWISCTGGVIDAGCSVTLSLGGTWVDLYLYSARYLGDELTERRAAVTALATSLVAAH